MSKIAARATIYIDGQKKFIGNSYSYTDDNTTRSDSVGKSGVAGYVEDPIASKVVCELINTPEAPTDGISKITDATIVLDLLDGTKQLTYFGCWYSGDPAETNEEGRVSVEFHSKFPPKRTK